MFYIKKTSSTGRLEINLFGIRMKFNLAPYNDRLNNLLYELADPRTLQKVKLPKILGINDSIDEVIASGKSVARYGDGEFKLLMGESIGFQNASPVLSERLKEIIRNEDDKVLVGIVDIFGYCGTDYWRKIIMLCRETLYKYMSFSNTYINANLARCFIFNTEADGIAYYEKLKSIWKNKDVVIVEGAGSRLGVGNDLFSNTKSIQRILCPIKNAFSKYDEILAECSKIQKDKLFILALGPTATVLAYDLAQKGYRAIDIGHLDTCYESFLRKSDKFVHVEGKITFNSERYNCMIKPCKDADYNSQIIAKIK